jgi:cytidylate kinase
MTVVTLGGLTGGGGRLLGPKLAERLDADYVDRLILTNAARHVGATVEALHQREQRPPTRGERFSGLLQRILDRSAATGVGGDPYFGPGAMAFLTQEFEEIPQQTITRGHELEDDKYIEAMRSVMHQLAESGNVVIVGRGGSIILRSEPNVLRVGTVARLEDRITGIMERDRIDRAQAEQTLTDRDLARAYYFKRYFDLDDPDDPELYHLVINTSDIDMDYAVDMVTEACAALEKGTLERKPAPGG